MELLVRLRTIEKDFHSKQFDECVDTHAWRTIFVKRALRESLRDRKCLLCGNENAADDLFFCNEHVDPICTSLYPLVASDPNFKNLQVNILSEDGKSDEDVDDYSKYNHKIGEFLVQRGQTIESSEQPFNTLTSIPRGEEETRKFGFLEQINALSADEINKSTLSKYLLALTTNQPFYTE